MPDDFERPFWDDRFRRICPPCPPCRCDRDRRDDRRDDSKCLSEKELAALSADLVVLSDMLANIIAHQDLCPDNHDST